jgi:hypothetical protein
MDASPCCGANLKSSRALRLVIVRLKMRPMLRPPNVGVDEDGFAVPEGNSAIPRTPAQGCCIEAVDRGDAAVGSNELGEGARARFWVHWAACGQPGVGGGEAAE